MIKLAIHTYGMANHFLENGVPMLHMARNKKNGVDLVFYFEANEKTKILMKEYTQQKR